MIVPRLTASLGQQVIVENRGGSVIIVAQMVAKAPPDGYTLLYYGSALWLLPFLQDKVPSRSHQRFIAYHLALNSPNILVVHPSLPVKSVQDLIALAQAKPGELNYASGIAGSSSQLSAELFKSYGQRQHHAYSSQWHGPALVAMLGGEVRVMPRFSASAVAPHLKSGRLRALSEVCTGAQPSAVFPELPTVAASGPPGVRIGSATGAYLAGSYAGGDYQSIESGDSQALNSARCKERI